MSLHGPHLHVHADINDAVMTQSLRSVDGKQEVKAHHVAVKSTITCTIQATFEHCESACPNTGRGGAPLRGRHLDT